MDFKGFIQSFKIHTVPIPFTEKLRSSLLGGMAILLLGWVLKYLPQANYSFGAGIVDQQSSAWQELPGAAYSPTHSTNKYSTQARPTGTD
ncbi:hypothetical protein [Candidatus Nitrotoga sp. AM1P]|uniref:hypothetical protein n=1 Tax=Candidatus Nitrotoga sp. AM1P TaxID=2559597 RepID=UPI0015652D64|nr:hypothetical protein [Candidatus Nitrotoga sp. AM1P]